MKSSGKPWLMTASVIYIVIGAILIILSLLALVLSGLIWDFVNSMGVAQAIAFIPFEVLSGVLFLVFLIPGIFDLVIGIIGVKQSGDSSKAMFFIVVGIVLAALTLIGSFSTLGFGTILSLILPALFIIGGFMNKKDAGSSVQV